MTTDGSTAGAEGGEDQEHDDTPSRRVSAAALLQRARRGHHRGILRARVYRPESLVWLEGYQALLRWRQENEITGLYAVPYDTEVNVPDFLGDCFVPGRLLRRSRSFHLSSRCGAAG